MCSRDRSGDVHVSLTDIRRVYYINIFCFFLPTIADKHIQNFFLSVHTKIPHNNSRTWQCLAFSYAAEERQERGSLVSKYIVCTHEHSAEKFSPRCRRYKLCSRNKFQPTELFTQQRQQKYA